jgi:hypothetical protein
MHIWRVMTLAERYYAKEIFGGRIPGSDPSDIPRYRQFFFIATTSNLLTPLLNRNRNIRIRSQEWEAIRKDRNSQF